MVIQEGEMLTLGQARELFPSVARPDFSSLYRWCADGCRGVKLEHVRVGRKMLTTKAAVDSFVSEMTAHYDADRRLRIGPRPTTRRTSKRERDIENAKDTLARAGIL